MAHKQTIADRIEEEASVRTRMVGTEASDDDLCHRCGGFMVDERYYDFRGGRPFQGVRCVNCGEMLDPLIRAHHTRKETVVSVGL